MCDRVEKAELAMRKLLIKGDEQEGGAASVDRFGASVRKTQKRVERRKKRTEKQRLAKLQRNKREDEEARRVIKPEDYYVYTSNDDLLKRIHAELDALPDKKLEERLVVHDSGSFFSDDELDLVEEMQRDSSAFATKYAGTPKIEQAIKAINKYDGVLNYEVFIFEVPKLPNDSKFAYAVEVDPEDEQTLVLYVVVTPTMSRRFLDTYFPPTPCVEDRRAVNLRCRDRVMFIEVYADALAKVLRDGRVREVKRLMRPTGIAKRFQKSLFSRREEASEKRKKDPEMDGSAKRARSEQMGIGDLVRKELSPLPRDMVPAKLDERIPSLVSTFLVEGKEDLEKAFPNSNMDGITAVSVVELYTTSNKDRGFERALGYKIRYHKPTGVLYFDVYQDPFIIKPEDAKVAANPFRLSMITNILIGQLFDPSIIDSVVGRPKPKN